MAAYPWLLVIDGLDEVPASSNRRQVLDAIQAFPVDAHGCNADLLLVATSRPQGYNDDFDPRYYRHRHLLPLDVPWALHYAGRLALQRWGADQDKRQRILTRLERAGKEEATAHLMRSPLQVTIMTLLVETVGQPPQERWRLFNDYYQVIFRREKERAIAAAELLAAYQKDIDAIHERVGLTLQQGSERTGGTEALLTEDAFAGLVDQRLAAEGHAGAELTRLALEILQDEAVARQPGKLKHRWARSSEIDADAMLSWPLADLVPWLIAACVRSLRDGFDKRELLAAVSRGDLGNAEDWKSAEARWGSEKRIAANKRQPSPRPDTLRRTALPGSGTARPPGPTPMDRPG